MTGVMTSAGGGAVEGSSTTVKPPAALLEISNVSVSYTKAGSDPVQAVAGMSLSVQAGQILGLVGETGCGKSTLARAIVGLEPLESGAIRFDDQPVQPLRRSKRPQRLRRLQMIFQDPLSSLNPRIRVGRQLENAVRSSASGASPHTRVPELLELVGLPWEARSRFAHEFSGGQRQRIAIARVLAAEPRMIVADEPIAALDASAQAQIANLLKNLCRELGLGLIFISHDLSIVRQIADRTAVMYLGRIAEEAPTAELWDHPTHPYTRALIAAVPRVGGDKRLPTSLPGDVPDPAAPPPGCRFHPRCPLATEICRTTAPTATVVDDRTVFCWHADRPAGTAPKPMHSSGG